jgi:hypothetical protein
MLKQISCFTLVVQKQDLLQNVPNLLVTPVLAENFSRIVLSSRQIVDSNNLVSNSLADMVEREGIMVFVKLGMWDSTTIHSSLVVPEHVARVANQNAKI